MRRQKKNGLNRIFRPLLAQKKRKGQTARRTLRLESLESRQMLSAVPWMPNHGGPDHTAADAGSGPEAAAYVARELPTGGDACGSRDSVAIINPDSMRPVAQDGCSTGIVIIDGGSHCETGIVIMQGGSNCITGVDDSDEDDGCSTGIVVLDGGSQCITAVDGGGDEGEPQGRDRCGTENQQCRDPGMARGTDYNTTRSNHDRGSRSSGDSGAIDHNSTRSNRSPVEGGGGGPDEVQGTDYNLRGSITVNLVNVKDAGSSGMDSNTEIVEFDADGRRG